MSREPLRETRARAGITQNEMATRLGLSLRQYQDLEGGAAPLRELHTLAQDMASMNLALDPEHGTHVLTPTAVKVIDALASRIRPEDRARAGILQDIRSTLSDVEVRFVQEFEDLQRGGLPMSDGELRTLLDSLEALKVDRNGGRISLSDA